MIEDKVIRGTILKTNFKIVELQSLPRRIVEWCFKTESLVGRHLHKFNAGGKSFYVKH